MPKTTVLNSPAIKIIAVSEMQTETDYKVTFLIRWPSGRVWEYHVDFLSQFIFKQVMQKAKHHPGAVASWIKQHSIESHLYEQLSEGDEK